MQERANVGTGERSRDPKEQIKTHYQTSKERFRGVGTRICRSFARCFGLGARLLKLGIIPTLRVNRFTVVHPSQMHVPHTAATLGSPTWTTFTAHNQAQLTQSHTHQPPNRPSHLARYAFTRCIQPTMHFERSSHDQEELDDQKRGHNTRIISPHRAASSFRVHTFHI